MVDSIPLTCTLCPRKPSFSDVSHLLTHVGSKGHLSSYYKTKLRAASDDSARALLESYDEWYQDWGVETLMSNRMNSKDKKRARTAAPSTTHIVAENPPRARAQKKQKTNNSNEALAVTNSPDLPITAHRVLDSDLRKSHVHDPPQYSVRPPLHQLDPNMTMPSQSTLYTGRETAHGAHCASLDQDEYPYFSSYAPNSLFVLQQPLPVYPPPSVLQTMPSSLAISAEEQVTREVPNYDGPVTTGNSDDISGPTKLRGVLWPRMSLFDSASPTTRRMRNQRKNSSVLEQLEANSQYFEPREMIWTPMGSFMKEKIITGRIDDNSSPFEHSPPGGRHVDAINIDISSPITRAPTRHVATAISSVTVDQGLDDSDNPPKSRVRTATGRKKTKKRKIQVARDATPMSSTGAGTVVSTQPNSQDLPTRSMSQNEPVSGLNLKLRLRLREHANATVTRVQSAQLPQQQPHHAHESSFGNVGLAPASIHPLFSSGQPYSTADHFMLPARTRGMYSNLHRTPRHDEYVGGHISSVPSPMSRCHQSLQGNLTDLGHFSLCSSTETWSIFEAGRLNSAAIRTSGIQSHDFESPDVMQLLKDEMEDETSVASDVTKDFDANDLVSTFEPEIETFAYNSPSITSTLLVGAVPTPYPEPEDEYDSDETPDAYPLC